MAERAADPGALYDATKRRDEAEAREHRIEFLPKKKIEIIVEDKDVKTVVDSICERGRTGSVGDGKIFILPVEQVVF